MPREIKMPKLSDTMEEGTINVWRKREGDRIDKGDVLVEVETDKADMEFEAYVAGTLAKILVHEGETVAIGTPIAIVRLDRDRDEDLAAFLAERGATAPEAVPAAPPAAPAPSAPVPRAAPQAPAPPAAAAPMASAPPGAGLEPTSRIPFFLPDPDRVRATPRARAWARERNLDLSEIAGSGPEGAILAADVERYLETLEETKEELLPGDVHVTPVAARIADELGIDLTRVEGSGPGGRITKRDLRAHLDREERRGPARETALFGDEIKLSQKRKFLIRNMVQSKQEAPHFYITMEVDAEPLDAIRERLRGEGKHITYTHLILKATALALERFPEVNATFGEDRIRLYNPINIALAVDVQDELVAPVVKDCQGREVEDLARAADALIRKARERKLQPEDYSDGTITISNLGMFGVDHFYAIITPPQSTVLSIGAVRSIPIVEGSELRVGRCFSFGLGVDHRVLDGVKAAQFLRELCRLVEHPEELFGSSAAHGD
jgi:pyruvate dehydrogenase E2 component (dihydrolipoamide acetyltransferase)